jgi:hypothetical protein
MALTANITTPDGVEHPEAYGLIYPMQITALDTEMSIRADIHCWHNEAARESGKAELNGFPASVSWSGDDAGVKLVETLAGLAGVQWGADPVANAMIAQQSIVAALETAVVSVDTRFTRAL